MTPPKSRKSTPANGKDSKNKPAGNKTKGQAKPAASKSKTVKTVKTGKPKTAKTNPTSEPSRTYTRGNRPTQGPSPQACPSQTPTKSGGKSAPTSYFSTVTVDTLGSFWYPHFVNIHRKAVKLARLQRQFDHLASRCPGNDIGSLILKKHKPLPLPQLQSDDRKSRLTAYLDNLERERQFAIWAAESEDLSERIKALQDDIDSTRTSAETDFEQELTSLRLGLNLASDADVLAVAGSASMGLYKPIETFKAALFLDKRYIDQQDAELRRQDNPPVDTEMQEDTLPGNDRAEA